MKLEQLFIGNTIDGIKGINYKSSFGLSGKMQMQLGGHLSPLKSRII